jgi:hypothetical protein
VALLQRKEIDILKRVSFNRNVVQFYGFCLDKSAPMLVRTSVVLHMASRCPVSGLQPCMPALSLGPAGPLDCMPSAHKLDGCHGVGAELKRS